MAKVRFQRVKTLGKVLEGRVAPAMLRHRGRAAEGGYVS